MADTAPQAFRYQIFSSTDNPITRDTKLWRYLTFEKFAWLFEKELLHHRRLDRLGDPFEGSVTVRYAQKRDAGETIGYMPLPELEPINNVRLMLTSYATCWYSSSDESAAMWKLYSREDAGVAVVTTPARMASAVDTSPHPTAMLGPVEYLDFKEDDMTLPFGKKAMPGFSKRRSFSYEKEVRGIIRLSDSPENPQEFLSQDRIWNLQQQLKEGIDAKVNLESLVLEIVLSPLSKAWFDELVCVLAERCGLGYRVRKSSIGGTPIY